jgi:hypothetical protein
MNDDRQKKIDDARAMLAFLEAHPQFPMPYWDALPLYPKTVNEFLSLVTAQSLEGTFKTFGDYLVLTVGESIKITLSPDAWQTPEHTHGTLLVDEAEKPAETRKPKRIRITGCSNDAWWYRDSIGLERAIIAYEVVDPTNDCLGSVAKSDAEVIEWHAAPVPDCDGHNQNGLFCTKTGCKTCDNIPF